MSSAGHRDITRLLETHRVFDVSISGNQNNLDGASNEDLVGNIRSVTPSSILSLGLLYKICRDFEEDIQKRNTLFRAVCENFCKDKYLDSSASLLCDIVANQPAISDRITQYISGMQSQLRNAVGDVALVRPMSIFRQISVTYQFEDGFYAKGFDEISKIADGGFGTVCKALHKVDGVTYAVKKIEFKIKNDKEFNKILREVRSLAALKHTNIVNYNHAWLENSTFTGDFDSDSDSDETEQSVCSSVSQNSAIRKDSLNYSSILHDSEIISFDCDSASYSSTHSLSQVEYEVDTHEDIPLESPFVDNNDIVGNNNIVDNNDIVGNNDLVDNNDKVTRRRRHSSGPTCSHLDPQPDAMPLVPVVKCDIIDISNKEQVVSRTSQQRNFGVQATLFIQMEYCNSDLRQLLENRGTPEGKAAWIKMDHVNVFHQILCGVEHIHSKSIIHRDLKPRNIFMSKDSNVVKIGDFGLACLVHQTEENCLHCFCSSGGTSAVLGTPPYSAPEQKVDNQDYNFKVDIYSLGIIFFELLHPCQTLMEFSREVEKIMNDDYPQHLTTEQISLIRKMIKSDPNERPDAAEILRSPLFKKKSLKMKIEDIRKIIFKLNKAMKRSESDMKLLKDEQSNLSEQMKKLTIAKDKEIKALKKENSSLKKLLHSM